MRGCWIGLVLSACAAPPASLARAAIATAATTDDRASAAADAPPITVPDVTGRSRAEAEAALRAAGARAEIEIRNVPDGVDLATAHVCAQAPGAGQETSATSPMSLDFSCNEAPRAPEPAIVLVGVSVAEATRRLRAAGYAGAIDVQANSDDPACKPGTVCDVAPEHWADELEQRQITLVMHRDLQIAGPRE